MFELFFEHAFWRMLHINNLKTAVSASSSLKLLTLVGRSFYPISCAAPLAFKAVLDFTANEQARFLWETEMGQRPPFGTHKGLPHSAQFCLMLESLVGQKLHHDPELTKRYLRELNVGANLQRAVAVGDVIEHVAPTITYRIANLVVVMQVAMAVDAGQVDSAWLCEHWLSEGVGEDQHIAVVRSMTAGHQEILGPGYEQEQNRYIELTHQHLDRVLAL